MDYLEVINRKIWILCRFHKVSALGKVLTDFQTHMSASTQRNVGKTEEVQY